MDAIFFKFQNLLIIINSNTDDSIAKAVQAHLAQVFVYCIYEYLPLFNYIYKNKQITLRFNSQEELETFVKLLTEKDDTLKELIKQKYSDIFKHFEIEESVNIINNEE